MPVGFTLTVDKIHGTRGEVTLNSTLEIEKRSHFSLIIEGLILTRLIPTGPKMFSMSSKTFKLRFSKLEFLKLSFKIQINHFCHFLQDCICCVSARDLGES